MKSSSRPNKAGWRLSRRNDDAFAEHDQSVPANVIPDLKAALNRTDVKAPVEVFPGTNHGLCFPERAVYDTLAAETTWDKIFALWDRHLK